MEPDAPALQTGTLVLEASRDYQDTVSNRLREQVLGALRELLHGFQDADRLENGALLGDYRRGHLHEVYAGLVTVLMRIVFVLYAEERGLLPMEPDLYATSYSLTRLHEQLLADYGRHGGAIDRRYGAWARIIALFRALHDGVHAAGRGGPFDPDAAPFLEGRVRGDRRRTGERLHLPRVSDGVVMRILDGLLVLDGERLRYGRLDVEQIGSIYEGLMGFDVVAEGDALQPGQERRKSGSHYTPRSLTQPIVEATLRPILERLGPEPRPEQLLELKICDPAMGSGAFLVETCRQLSDQLVAAWRRTGTTPDLPPDALPLLHAARLVAQRCLYGVDKNPLAVDLARLSLWLATSAKEHPFTFVDHALRCGDSLVGLSREQIVSMSLDVEKGKQVGIARPAVEAAVERAEQLRREIHAIGDPPDTAKLASLWKEADEALDVARQLGDLVVAAFFSADSEKARRQAVERVAQKAAEWLQTGAHDAELRGMTADLREGPKPIRPFHWEIEFPEVFAEGAAAANVGGAPVTRGFSAIVGNPPWVSYAGRAAQPLDDRVRGYFATFYDAFAGYRNLQALFVERAARLLAPLGRLGLVLPSSMAELDGYAPSRAAHDGLAECDAELPDLGEDTFRGVFQPSMVLRSTRFANERADANGTPWPIARPDLDADARRILVQLDGPTLPAALFGERGLQSSGEDVEHLLEQPASGTVPVRVGSDIRAFRRGPPSQHAETSWFGTRLREAAEWTRVKVLVRQTARVPIAARSDGAAFRNSLLAGFEDAEHPADFLVAYLNSTPVRWCHHTRHRDARFGMPQVKIGHLRAIPAPRDRSVVGALADLGATWSERNGGIDEGAQRRLDEIVARGLGVSRADLERMQRDAQAWS